MHLANFEHYAYFHLSCFRLESHYRVFCTIFLHQLRERSRKFIAHYCGHVPLILLHSFCEKENQCLASLAEFLRGNRAKLYFLSKFSKTCCFHRRKLSFSRTFENMELWNAKNAAKVNVENDASQLSTKNIVKKLPLLI